MLSDSLPASTNSRIIDSHQHVNWHGRDTSTLIQDLDIHGIDQAWILTWEIHPLEDDPAVHKALNPSLLRPDGTHPGITLQEVLEAARSYPERFVAGYCPHPFHETAPDLLEAAVHMHGIQVCGEWKFRIPLDDPRCLRLFAKAGELELPVVLHLDVAFLPPSGGSYQKYWYGGGTDALARVLAACPETNFIGHAPGFWRDLSTDGACSAQVYPEGPVEQPGPLYGLFDQHPNLYADLSAGSALRALSRDPDHAVRFLERYQDRLLFGRDYYGNELLSFLKSLSLAEGVRAKIFGHNAASLLYRQKPEPPLHSLQSYSPRPLPSP